MEVKLFRIPQCRTLRQAGQIRTGSTVMASGVEKISGRRIVVARCGCKLAGRLTKTMGSGRRTSRYLTGSAVVTRHARATEELPKVMGGGCDKQSGLR